MTGAFEGIEQLEEELAQRGLEVPLLLVHSAGGSITVGEARRVPVGLAESGPAAGVAASAALAHAEGTPEVVTCDMGGTSLDVSVIAGGTPVRRTRGELMGVWTALSLIDVESIGAGGGSIGWVDARGMLRVGPRSAGAVPGPACYGRGGTDTDGDRRPGRPRLPRPGTVPGRGDVPRRRGGRRAHVPAWVARWGWTPTRRRGASARWPRPAWSKPSAPALPPAASTRVSR